MAGACAQFVQVAQKERVFGVRVSVDAGEEHIGPVVEDGLRAVAVVVIDVEHGNAWYAAVPQCLRRQRRIVHETVAAKEVGARVVARRAAQGERRARAVSNSLRRVQRAERTLTRRLPRACGQR